MRVEGMGRSFRDMLLGDMPITDIILDEALKKINALPDSSMQITGYFGTDADMLKFQRSIPKLRDSMWCLPEPLDPAFDKKWASKVPSLGIDASMQRFRETSNYTPPPMPPSAFGYDDTRTRGQNLFDFHIPKIEIDPEAFRLIPETMLEQIARDLRHSMNLAMDRELIGFQPTGLINAPIQNRTPIKVPWYNKYLSMYRTTRERLARRLYKLVSGQGFPDEYEEDW